MPEKSTLVWISMTGKRVSDLVIDRKFEEADQLLAEIPPRDAMDTILEIAIHPRNTRHRTFFEDWAIHRGALFFQEK